MYYIIPEAFVNTLIDNNYQSHLWNINKEIRHESVGIKNRSYTDFFSVCPLLAAVLKNLLHTVTASQNIAEDSKKEQRRQEHQHPGRFPFLPDRFPAAQIACKVFYQNPAQKGRKTKDDRMAVKGF